MEKLLVLERKTLTDLITIVLQRRTRFFKLCEKMTKYRLRALLAEASYEDIKSRHTMKNTIPQLEVFWGLPHYRCIALFNTTYHLDNLLYLVIKGQPWT